VQRPSTGPHRAREPPRVRVETPRMPGRFTDCAALCWRHIYRRHRTGG